jgi:hypothetical protein
VTQTLPHSPPLALPPVPRRVTPRAARRSWGEGHERVWWTSALAVLLVAAYIAASGIREELKLRRLLRDGVDVVATAYRVKGVTASDNPHFGVQRDQTIPVDFRATLPDGREVEMHGYLPVADKWIKVNDKVRLRVDPGDPDNFTETADPRSWWHVTGVALFIVLPIAAILLAVAEWRRRAMLKVWRTGQVAEGVVVDVRHPAAAPRSRVVRYTVSGSRDRRVFKMLYPIRAGIPVTGQPLNLLMLPDRPQDAIVAELYAEPG